MRKWRIPLIALVLLVALASSALAMGTKDMYVTKDNVKAYDTPSKHGNVVETFDRGDLITFIDVSDDGKWYGYYLGEDYMGWVQKKYLSEDEPCDHEWSKWEIEKEATCTRTGLKTRYCKLCGLEEEEVIKKTAHTFGKWTVTREASCTREGERTRTCKLCGYEETERIARTPHEYGPWKITVKATDHSSGKRTHTCNVCGESESESYDPDGTLRRRDKGAEVRQLQQQLADQGYLNKGGVDGSFGGSTETALKKFQRDQGLEPDGIAWPQTLKRLNHEFGPWEVTTPVTRTADGQRTRTCTDCGYQETEAIPAEPTFQRRARGEGVRMLQTMLNDLGYTAGSADGVYGGKLDTAFTAFGQSDGTEFTAGTVTPANIDALTNQWIAAQSAADWKGEGNKNSDIELTLTVNPVDSDAVGVRAFEWTLTNLGPKRCKFNLLLLGFGSDHDFTKDNLVMVIDNAPLKANGGNTLSGTFYASADWDAQSTGIFCFCALAKADTGTEKWLSNVEVYADL